MPAPDLQVVVRPLSATQAATRQRLLDAARQLASEGGYDAVSMRAVAEGAGVSAPTAYQYFASRDHVLVELLTSLADAASELFAARPSRRRDPGERAAATLRRVVKLVEQEPELFVAMLRAYLSGAPEVRHARTAMESSMRSWIDSALGSTPVADRDEVVSILEAVLFTGMAGLVIGGHTPADLGDDLERAALFLLSDGRAVRAG
jgi:AcrR family transcriptional regulator